MILRFIIIIVTAKATAAYDYDKHNELGEASSLLVSSSCGLGTGSVSIVGVGEPNVLVATGGEVSVRVESPHKCPGMKRPSGSGAVVVAEGGGW